MEQEIKKPTTTQEEYFFPGGTEYLPTTIIASSRAEAEKEWQRVRASTGQPTQSTPKTEEEIITKKNK